MFGSSSPFTILKLLSSKALFIASILGFLSGELADDLALFLVYADHFSPSASERVANMELGRSSIGPLPPTKCRVHMSVSILN